MLFYCTAAMVIAIMFYRFTINDYMMKPQWLKSDWIREKVFKYRLGLDYSYFGFAVLFALVGATFGWAFANTEIDNYLFEGTTPDKRGLRAVIGVLITIMIYKLFHLLPVDNYLTDYVFYRALPNLIVTYTIFGIYPVFCKHIGKLKYKLTYFIGWKYLR